MGDFGLQVGQALVHVAGVGRDGLPAAPGRRGLLGHGTALVGKDGGGVADPGAKG